MFFKEYSRIFDSILVWGVLQSVITNNKSSYWRCSVKKGVLRNFVKFTGKHPCQSLFFNKVAGQACNFIKKRLWHRCFPVNFVKFLRKPFSKENLRWLLLNPFFQPNVSFLYPLCITASGNILASENLCFSRVLNLQLKVINKMFAILRSRKTNTKCYNKKTKKSQG